MMEQPEIHQKPGKKDKTSYILSHKLIVSRAVNTTNLIYFLETPAGSMAAPSMTDCNCMYHQRQCGMFVDKKNILDSSQLILSLFLVSLLSGDCKQQKEKSTSIHCYCPFSSLFKAILN
jgi:hypothetical protein